YVLRWLGFTWRTADDRRRFARLFHSGAPRLAQSALDCPDHGAVDAFDLLAAGHSCQRRFDHGGPADAQCAHRGRLVARPPKHGPDARPTPPDLARGHWPLPRF